MRNRQWDCLCPGRHSGSYSKRGQSRSHSPKTRVLLRIGINLTVRHNDGMSNDRSLVGFPRIGFAKEDLHCHVRGHLTRGSAAHTVADDEETALYLYARSVLVSAPH